MDVLRCFIFIIYAVYLCSAVNANYTTANKLIDEHKNWKLFDNKFCGEAFPTDRIIGGKDAKIGQYPWLAQIGYFNHEHTMVNPIFTCGGALINRCWVVTAGHCVPVKKEIYIAKIRLGEYDTSKSIDCQSGVCADPVQDFNPARLLVHKYYTEQKIQNDIALIKLHKPAEYTKWVRPICLPSGSLLSKEYPGVNMEVAGWGMYDPEIQEMSKILQTVVLTGINIFECQKAFPTTPVSSNRQICVGGKAHLDTCSGDSGGPLMIVEANPDPKYYLAGIVSFGTTKCGIAGKPAVYTSVARYMKFILQNVTPC